MPTLNFFSPDDRGVLLGRLQALRPDTQPLWGVMNAAQMLDHLSRALEISMGTVRVKKVFAKGLAATIARVVFLDWVPRFPKNLRTAPEMKAPPCTAQDFEPALARFYDRVGQALQQHAQGQPFAPSPIFGPLTPEQTGRLLGKHIDHHLRQFGL
jgi:hypothetical protein